MLLRFLRDDARNQHRGTGRLRILDTRRAYESPYEALDTDDGTATTVS